MLSCLQIRSAFANALCSYPKNSHTPLQTAFKDLDKLAAKALKHEEHITETLIPRFLSTKSDTKREAIRSTIQKEFIKLGSTARKYKLAHANVLFGLPSSSSENENNSQRSRFRLEASDGLDANKRQGREADAQILRMCAFAMETLDQGLLLIYDEVESVGVVKKEDRGMMKNMLRGAQIVVPNRYSALQSVRDLRNIVRQEKRRSLC
jgi:DNA-binding transcriptional regulator YbjK